MAIHYSATVNASHNFEISTDQIQALDLVDNHLLFEQKSYSVEWLERDLINKKYVLAINGVRFEVQLGDDLDRLINTLGLSAKTDTNATDIFAPMPGRIISIDISPGQKVKKGDTLITLEAMKMENTLQALNDGTVKAVCVAAGETVGKKQLLVQFE